MRFSRSAILLLALYANSSFALFEDNEARQAILNLREQLSASQKANVELQNQVEELAQENAKLLGRTEVLEKQVEDLIQQQKSFYQDINQRLRRFEPQTMEIEGVQGVVQPGEAEAYEAALKAFQAGALGKSEQLFSAFVKKYPNSPYWPLAQFWLGNTQYAQKDYKAAIAVLDGLIKRYPLHARVPDAMLTLGQSQLEFNQKVQAKKTLETLVDKHPDTEAANLAKQTLKRIK